MNFTADQIIGKQLYTKQATPVFTLPDSTSAILKTIAAGGLIGEVYSYITRDGLLWWQIASGGYVKHEKGKFDIKKLTDQGAISVETLNAPSLADQSKIALSALLSGLKWAIPAALIIFAAYWIIKTYNLTK